MNELSTLAVRPAPSSKLNTVTTATLIIAAATTLLPYIERGQLVDAAILRTAMQTAFGASDSTGAWTWKIAYDACEAAAVLFLRKFGRAPFRKSTTPPARLSALSKIADLFHRVPISETGVHSPAFFLGNAPFRRETHTSAFRRVNWISALL
jgi:hypothetical protein